MAEEQREYRVSVAGSPVARIAARTARQAAYIAARSVDVSMPGARVAVFEDTGVREFWLPMGGGDV